jgi:phage terminase small subunit
MDEEKEKPLTDKQRRFCEEYVVDWNGTRAAIVAGYSEKTASEASYENLRKPQIENYIKEVRSNLSKATGITAISQLLEYKKIAYSNMANLKSDWTTFKKWEDLTEDEKATISEITHSEITIEEGVTKEVVKVKTHDKIKALARIDKMLGYDIVEPEKEESNTGSLTINIGTNGIKELPSHEDDIIDFTENE